MNQILQDGNSIITTKDKIIINGEEIKIPAHIKTNSTTIINGRVFLGGYEYIPKTKEFKRTLRALWELFF